MTYRIEVTPAARRDLRKLSTDILHRIDAHILALAANPYPPGTEKLKGNEDIFRVRVGDYRILYTVERRQLVILVIRVRHRRDVYQG